MKTPKHEVRGNGVYVERIEVARFNDSYAARRFADFANNRENRESAIDLLRQEATHEKTK